MQLFTENISLTGNGEQIILVTLDNEMGVKVKITNYGGIITHIYTPDKFGNSADVVLGFENPEDYYSAAYKENCAYFGAITGRFCNRISHGKFMIDNRAYRLETNSGKHHLHGGKQGFDKVVWKAETLIKDESVSLILSHLSPDGDQGYPGNLQTYITYTLNRENELIIDYQCVSDKATPVNFTNHSYFNLSGNFVRDVMDHEVTIDAAYFTENDDSLVPTGRILSVEGSLLDFNLPSLIREKAEQRADGIDQNFVLDSIRKTTLPAARISEKRSGRVLEIFTSEPGLQFFTYKAKNYPLRLKKGIDLNQFYGLALEPQHFPDSPNHPDFPDTILRPGETYKQSTTYRFSTDAGEP